MPAYEPIPDLPRLRRVVTGHDQEGKAVFERDEWMTPVGASSAHPSLGFSLVHRTTGFPVTNGGGDSEFSVDNLQRSQHPLGIVCEIVDIPPGSGGGLLHRNQSLDYGVVLSGSLVLELDEGVKRTLTAGDIFVQRGTTHAWSNPGDDLCRFMTVIIPSQVVRIGPTDTVLEATKMPGLTE